jgi:hypothetical protein
MLSRMKTARYLLANLHAGFMDAAVGVFLISLLTYLFGIPFQWWYVPLGAFLTLLPDFDIIVPILKRTFDGLVYHDNHHKSWFHFPFFMLPLTSLIGYAVGGDAWEVIIFISVLAHYCHDAFMMGKTGIYWLTRYQKNTWPHDGALDPSFIPHNEWLTKNWLRVSKLMVVESTIGVLALVLASAVIFLQTV